MVVPQPVVPAEIDDVGRNCHHQCWTEATPQCEITFVSRNLLETVEGGGEGLALCLFHCTLGTCRGCITACHAEVGIVSNPEYFSTTCGDTQIRRKLFK